MKRYFIRVAKYVLQLTILFLLMFSILNLVGQSSISLEQMLSSERGLLMIGIIAFFALLQPFFGYTKKNILFDVDKRSEDLDRVMGMCGYVKVSDDDGVKVYRASSAAKKLLLMYEDAITITTKDGISVMYGPRKEVVKAHFRMGTFIG